MRQENKNYLTWVLNRFPERIQEPIYEMGSFRVAGQETFADLRPFFPGKKFVGLDMRPGLGVDEIQDVMKMTLPDNCAGMMLCFDTLEHVENVHKAVDEMHRVIVPGGILIVSSVFDFRIHDYPSDYWRFTPEAFKLLLRPFIKSEVSYDGPTDNPLGIYGWGIK